MQSATRASVLAVERACTMAHALALAELANAAPDQAAEAEDIVHQMQAVLRDAKELAARIS